MLSNETIIQFFTSQAAAINRTNDIKQQKDTETMDERQAT